MATQVSVITRNGSTAYTLTTGGRGPKGDMGDVGATGPQGATGPIGPQGTTGATGATGPQFELTSGPVRSTAGTSSIADASLTIAKTSGLQAALDGKRSHTNIISHGAVSGQLCDTAIANAITAAVEAGHRTVLFPTGTWNINTPIVVNVAQLRFIGEKGATIVQTTSNHGIELSGIYAAARDFFISGINITGPGWAIDKSGIIWSNGGIYLGDQFTVEDCGISEFGNALNLGNVNKVEVTNLSSIRNRVGARLSSTQTWMFTNCRMVGGAEGLADMATSSCFVTSGTMFSGIVIGGEFGGANIERFADMSGGILDVYSANLEAFLSSQVINCTGTAAKQISLVSVRLSYAFSGTKALISANCTGNVGIPTLNISGLRDFSGTALIEIWGGALNGPSLTGDPQNVVFALAQGGTPYTRPAMWTIPGLRQTLGVASLPSSGTPISILGGLDNDSTDKLPDTWATNPVMRYLNHHTGAYGRSSLINDVLQKVLFHTCSPQTSAASNVDTNLLVTQTAALVFASNGYAIPAGSFKNYGESVTIVACGVFAANAESKVFKFIIDGTGGRTLTFAATTESGGAWRIEIEMIKSYDAGDYIAITATLRTTVGTQVMDTYATNNVDSAITVRLTGASATSGNIYMKNAKASWLRATPRL